MTRRPVRNLAASVHDRLLARAKAEDRPFDELLQYYAIERFLFRLSRSPHAGRFVLKGALMLQFWGGALTRSTRDVDLAGVASSTVPRNAGRRPGLPRGEGGGRGARPPDGHRPHRGVRHARRGRRAAGGDPPAAMAPRGSLDGGVRREWIQAHRR